MSFLGVLKRTVRRLALSRKQYCAVLLALGNLVCDLDAELSSVDTCDCPGDTLLNSNEVRVVGCDSPRVIMRVSIQPQSRGVGASSGAEDRSKLYGLGIKRR